MSPAPTTQDTAVREEYTARLEARRAEATRLGQRDTQLGNLRLGVFVAGVALAFLAFGFKLVGALWLVPVAAAFALLLGLHDRVIRRRERADRAVRFYEGGLARLDHTFAGRGEPGERFREPLHPYAEDIDLFGPGSLFELLCAARTRSGEDQLAAMLQAPSAPATIRERQQAVAELAGRLDLREELALLGEDVRAGLHGEALRAWGEAPAVFASAWLPVVAAALSLFTLAGFWLWIVAGAGPLPLAVGLGLQMGFAAMLRGRVATVASGVDAPAADLALLAALLECLEGQSFQAPRLEALRALLETSGVPPSRRIAQLRFRVEMLEARRNQLFAPVAALLLWKTQWALAIERWRRGCGPALGGFVDAVGEFEALASLSGFAHERADASYPEIADGEPCFEAEGLGHPLIAPDRCVRNDLTLGSSPRVLVVSGSNMSGKSTLLRTVGASTALALAGAPVCATRLRLTPLALGASIQLHDSLQEGSSRFYAEITRLRQIMGLAEGGLPVLFLLDEILHGTNSHDRGIGAEAVVRGLLARGALGLVTTHDLALARVADTLAPVARNVHFEDQIVEGRMQFDYRMRPGVVEKSNALELMRAVGLEV